MEEATELGNYLPLSFKSPKEQEYIAFLRDGQDLTEATSPFVFSTINERTILRFLKLIACNNGQIGTYARLSGAFLSDTIKHPLQSVC